ncbi:hypothetical protein HKD37_02G004829 [Glycine soja]
MIFPLSSSSNSTQILTSHPRPSVATTSCHCLPPNLYTKKNVEIGVESLESSSRIWWRKFLNPSFHNFSEVILTSKPFS